MNQRRRILLPEQIRGYRLIERLGRGSMGEVFRAEVVEGRRGLRLGEEVALKVLGRRFSPDASIVRRFKREAGLGLSLRHPGVAAVYQVGTFIDLVGDRRHFIAQELLDGRSIAEHLQQHGPLDEELLRSVALQVAGTLAFVHGRGIVHRDLKPANLFLDPAGRVKIVDFGLARLMRWDPQVGRAGLGPHLETEVSDSSIGQVPGASSGPVDGRTTSTHFVGTVAYASPEQLRGLPATPASDLFALGLVLYELGTGRHPFARQMAEGTEAYLEMVTSCEVERLDARRPQLSEFLSTVVQAMLKLDPAERLRDAEEVERRFAEGESGRWWIDATSRRDPSVPLHRRLVVRRRTRLVHRRAELEVLRSAVEALFEKGEGARLWIEGETGIGKTRLLDHFLRCLEGEGRSYELLIARAPQQAVAMPLDPLRRLLRDRLGLEGLPLDTAFERAAEALRDLLPRRRDREELLHHLVPVAEDRLLGRHRILRAYGAALRGMARRRPTLLVFEGVHHADPSTLEVLLALNEGREAEALLAVWTARPEVQPEAAAAAPLARLRQHAVVLSPPLLRPPHLKALLEERGLSATDGGSLAGALHSSCGGNPYLALEAIAGLSRRARKGEDLDLRRAGPATLDEDFARRFRRSSPVAKGVLEIAAVLGGHVRMATLRAVTGMSARDLSAALSDLDRVHSMVTEAGRSLRFRHGAFRSWMLARVPRSRRREVHAEVARAALLASRSGDAPEAIVEAVLHAEAGGLREILAAHLEKGVRWLRRRGAVPEALRLVRSTAVLATRAPADVGLRARAQELRGALAHQVGQREEEQRAYRELVRLSVRQGDPAMKARALRGLGRTCARTGQYVAAESLLRAALRAAEEVGEGDPAPSRALVQLDLAHAVLWSGDEERAGRILDGIQGREEEPAERARWSLERGNLLIELERFDEARSELRRGRRLAARSGDRDLRGELLLASARLLRELAEHERARRAARAAARRAEQDGNLRQRAVATYFEGDLAAREGRADDSRALLLRALRLARAVQERGLEAVARGALALLYRWDRLSRHSLPRGLRHARRSMRLARGIDSKRLEIRAQAALALICLDRGWTGRALTISQNAVSEVSSAGVARRRAAEVFHVHSLVLRRLERSAEGREFERRALGLIEQRLAGLSSPRDRDRVRRKDPLVRQILSGRPSE